MTFTYFVNKRTGPGKWDEAEHRYATGHKVLKNGDLMIIGDGASAYFVKGAWDYFTCKTSGRKRRKLK